VAFEDGTTDEAIEETMKEMEQVDWFWIKEK